ncbi:hypothetical protein OPQ81_002736 [Rhizoctonia solani]|nr:hypothetical protein OPQ81_002735 [Rhizoctonia solani]KAJ1302418.1 hypothetical protein OPQ81_002736 [Rhizoctonia solani]
MQFQTSLSRFSAFLLFFLSSLALLACASPVAAPAAAVALPGHGLVARGTCSVGCTTGTKTEEILIKLKADVDIQLGLLDKCLETGEKPDAVILKIEELINTAVAAISKLDVDLLGLLNGKITAIVNLLVYILISVATHCGKWVSKGAAEFEAFLQLCAKLDVALKALLSTCNGLGALLLVLIKVLVNVTTLVKVKFNLCIGILGL